MGRLAAGFLREPMGGPVGRLLGEPTCDAPKPGGPLTTRQPAEYS